MSPRRWGHGLVHPGNEVHHLWLFADALFRGYMITVACAVGHVAALGLGADTRFTGRGWATVNSAGGHYVWAGVFALYVLGLWLAPRISARATGWALQVAGATYLLWALGFAYAAWRSDGASSFTGAVTYGAIACWHISQAEAYWTGRP